MASTGTCDSAHGVRRGSGRNSSSGHATAGAGLSHGRAQPPAKQKEHPGKDHRYAEAEIEDVEEVQHPSRTVVHAGVARRHCPRSAGTAVPTQRSARANPVSVVEAPPTTTPPRHEPTASEREPHDEHPRASTPESRSPPRQPRRRRSGGTAVSLSTASPGR